MSELIYCPRCKENRVAVSRGDSIECSDCGLVGTPNIKWQDLTESEGEE